MGATRTRWPSAVSTITSTIGPNGRAGPEPDDQPGPRSRAHPGDEPVEAQPRPCPTVAGAPSSADGTVRELRLVLTVDDYERALAFYRDALGLHEQAAYDAPNGGRVTLLDAGRATVELADAAQADYIDEVEVGRRVAGRVRVAFEVPDAGAATQRLAEPVPR